MASVFPRRLPPGDRGRQPGSVQFSPQGARAEHRAGWTGALRDKQLAPARTLRGRWGLARRPSSSARRWRRSPTSLPRALCPSFLVPPLPCPAPRTFLSSHLSALQAPGPPHPPSRTRGVGVSCRQFRAPCPPPSGSSPSPAALSAAKDLIAYAVREGYLSPSYIQPLLLKEEACLAPRQRPVPSKGEAPTRLLLPATADR